MGTTVLICGSDHLPVTSPVQYVTLNCELKFNAVGCGELVAPATPDLVDAVTTPGNSVVVVRDGEYFGGGPIERPGCVSWSPDAGVGTITVNFGTWDQLLTRRLTYPDPELDADAQTSTSWAATAANAETAMRDLVYLNAGQGALATRQFAGLYLGDLAGVGTSIDVTTRFEVLIDVLRKIATAGGGLGFRVRQVGQSDLRFEVYEPTDRSESVRFSRGLMNLTSLKTDPEAPTGTVAIVGGDGTGASRTIVERSDTTAVASWGRYEIWVNQSGTDTTTTEMQQAGDTALVEHGEKAGISCTAVDGAQAQYGVDYWLGDQVSIEPTSGVSVIDVVGAVKLVSTPQGGDVVSPTIGSTQTTSRQTRQAREVERRMGRLERS
jgi:hypothetical protein